MRGVFEDCREDLWEVSGVDSGETKLLSPTGGVTGIADFLEEGEASGPTEWRRLLRGADDTFRFFAFRLSLPSLTDDDIVLWVPSVTDGASFAAASVGDAPSLFLRNTMRDRRPVDFDIGVVGTELPVV